MAPTLPSGVPMASSAMPGLPSTGISQSAAAAATLASLPHSQMTRQARRLYVGNIPFGITEVNVTVPLKTMHIILLGFFLCIRDRAPKGLGLG